MKGTARKKFTAGTILADPTTREVEAFETLQDILSRPTYLIHFDQSRRLYMDIDASKHGIGVVVYHISGTESDEYPARNAIEPIMFLSRLLTTAERITGLPRWR